MDDEPTPRPRTQLADVLVDLLLLVLIGQSDRLFDRVRGLVVGLVRSLRKPT